MSFSSSVGAVPIMLDPFACLALPPFLWYLCWAEVSPMAMMWFCSDTAVVCVCHEKDTRVYVCVFDEVYARPLRKRKKRVLQYVREEGEKKGSGLETQRFPNRLGCNIFLAIARFASVSRYTQTYYIVHTGRCTARFEGTERHYWLYASQ
ncbi:hypothetical protein E2C01_027541 [Portunus trituberculatus]|uniref:Uncharacterized protein n=1 Tax=Portunus trituberculatus TaxID=210409 RepID=A0A5B7EID7_PORTR|nr:hypothetical protein [Portunus trituberculatus]